MKPIFKLKTCINSQIANERETFEALIPVERGLNRVQSLIFALAG